MILLAAHGSPDPRAQALAQGLRKGLERRLGEEVLWASSSTKAPPSWKVPWSLQGGEGEWSFPSSSSGRGT